MTSLQVLPGVPADIQVLTGPLLLGYCFNWGLYGVLCMQMYMYFLGFPGDLNAVKGLVYSLFIVDTIQTALTTHNAWHFLVSGWGDPEALIKPGWSWIAVPLLSGLVSMTVQIFFAWRIKKISGSLWIAVPVVFLAVTQGICACISGIWFEVINDVTKISFLFPTATIWLAGSAVADIVIAFTMIILLRRSNTGFSGTDQLIRRLIRMTVETGSVTAFCAALELFLYLKWKENNLHMIPALALSKLYTNTLIATLNSRNPQYRTSQRTGSGMDTMGADLHFRTTTIDTSGVGGTASKIFNQDRSQSRGQTKVQITTRQETHHEDGIPMDTMDSKHAEDDFLDEDGMSVVAKVNSETLTTPNGRMTSDLDALSGHIDDEEDGGVRRYYQRRTTDDVDGGHHEFAPSYHVQ